MKMPEDSDALHDDPFVWANLSPKSTGLPFVVWIAPKMDAKQDVRVKVSRSLKVHWSELISVDIRPDVRVVDRGTLSASDLALLRLWVDINRDVIIRHWDGNIGDTGDAIAALKPI